MLKLTSTTFPSFYHHMILSILLLFLFRQKGILCAKFNPRLVWGSLLLAELERRWIQSSVVAALAWSQLRVRAELSQSRAGPIISMALRYPQLQQQSRL